MSEGDCGGKVAHHSRPKVVRAAAAEEVGAERRRRVRHGHDRRPRRAAPVLDAPRGRDGPGVARPAAPEPDRIRAVWRTAPTGAIPVVGGAVRTRGPDVIRAGSPKG